ncbi:hypothetical protein D9613_004395 [Agrocybe pediades]|uniref:Enoyl-CoA hydratase n=1 Tax=Agrocybe pediades TaxID=84607 RepID=A0A8H4QIU3_9AGAR|nr:hypothetical protein D9613_004395 [Agrocybe pediades]
MARRNELRIPYVAQLSSCHRLELAELRPAAALSVLLQVSISHKQISRSTLLSLWNSDKQSGTSNEESGVLDNPHGFGSISRRQSCVKPIIAAVNGGAYGGGLEMVLNCDLVVADEKAKFALPEVKRGVVAIQGGEFFF